MKRYNPVFCQIYFHIFDGASGSFLKTPFLKIELQNEISISMLTSWWEIMLHFFIDLVIPSLVLDDFYIGKSSVSKLCWLVPHQIFIYFSYFGLTHTPVQW